MHFARIPLVAMRLRELVVAAGFLGASLALWISPRAPRLRNLRSRNSSSLDRTDSGAHRWACENINAGVWGLYPASQHEQPTQLLASTGLALAMKTGLFQYRAGGAISLMKIDTMRCCAQPRVAFLKLIYTGNYTFLGGGFYVPGQRGWCRKGGAGPERHFSKRLHPKSRCGWPAASPRS